MDKKIRRGIDVGNFYIDNGIVFESLLIWVMNNVRIPIVELMDDTCVVVNDDVTANDGRIWR